MKMLATLKAQPPWHIERENDKVAVPGFWFVFGGREFVATFVRREDADAVVELVNARWREQEQAGGKQP